MIKRFIRYYKPQRKLFILDLLAALLVSVCDLCYPAITRTMLNDFIPNQRMNLLLLFAGVLVGVYLIKMGLNYFISYQGHLVGVYMQADMRRDLFLHLQKLPFSYYDEHETGGIMSRIINDLMDISELAHHGPEDLFISGVMIIGSFIYLCSINLYLTLIIFAFIPFLVFFSLKMRRRMSEAFLQTRKEIGAVNATLENSISGIRVSRAFTNGEYESEKFETGNRRFVQARSKAYKAMALFHSGTGFIISLLNAAVIIAGGLYTYYGVITYGDLVAYLLFVNLFVTPIRTLVNFMEQYQNGMTGFKRFCEIIDEPTEPENPNARELTEVKGRIELRDVCFSYDDSHEVLEHVTLTVEPGETLALVGPSGGGKTTICHLIPRFYPLQTGQICIDGIPIEDINNDSLRRSIGIVQQDVFLFNGTVRDNIAYGRLDASDEEIMQAAKRANIYDFALSLPEGFDTNIGERGVKLSGGQKQRLSIARVFLKNPAILILDEATSALDNATELLIQQSLNELCRGRTTLVVAHRLSTVRSADEIAVITGGRVRQQGSHEQLMAAGGLYKQLYEAQFADLNEGVAAD